jgi:hypothetical protein
MLVTIMKMVLSKNIVEFGIWVLHHNYLHTMVFVIK